MTTFTPRYTRSYILTGPAQLWIRPYSDSVAAALPPDTEPLGYDWSLIAGQNWRPIGATLEGVTVRLVREATDIRIEEQQTPVDQKTTNSQFTFTATLSQDNLETVRDAYGGGVIQTVAPATGVPGVQILTISDEIDHFSIGLEARARPRSGVTNPWRRVLVPDVTSVAEVETPYRRAEQQHVYPVTFSSLVPISECPVRELNAAAI